MKKGSPLKVVAVIILAVVIAIMLVLIVLFKVWSGNGGLSEEKMKSNIDKAGKIMNEVSYNRPDAYYSGESKKVDSFAVDETSVIENGAGNNTDTATNDKTDATDTDYLCSYSNERLVTEEDIDKLKNTKYDNLPAGKDIIQMVINEMYARHGYKFNNKDIQAYFDSKKWYKDIKDHNDNMDDIYNNMSDIERKNVDFISGHKEG
ncbi:MAG: YARHG domain-containing protein [Lachnospiraceae bacterium]|nr:YARHG domain-containing protein [Lachnospiraceae bacterium]